MKENRHDENRMRRSDRHRPGGSVPVAVLTPRHLLALAAAGLAYLAIHQVAIPLWGGFWREHASDLIAGMTLPAITAVIAAPDTPAGRWTRSVAERLVVTLFAAFAWEVVLPRINPHSVGDPIDAACYLLGTTFYIGTSMAWHHDCRGMIK